MPPFRARILAILLAALCVPPASAQEADPEAALLLARARRNALAGDFTAIVTCVRESFLGGRDTLRGVFESRPSRGERRLVLEGEGSRFEWWSRAGGAEQWRREEAQGRLRRLPPHSLRKPAFARDVSFEDLSLFPFGYLEGFRSARRIETGGEPAVSVVPGPGLALLYGSLRTVFDRDPVLLRRVEFAGNAGRPSKRMEIRRYAAARGGFFPEEVVFAAEDGLSRVTLTLSLTAEIPVGDKARAGTDLPRGFADPKWLPRGEGQ